jgi:hypothetical protein
VSLLAQMRIVAMRQSLQKQQNNLSVRVVCATLNLLARQSPEN